MARYIGKGAGIFAPPKKRAISIIPIDNAKVTRSSILAKENDLENFIKMYEFERITDRTIVMRKIEDSIEQGMAVYEENINTRRLMLRDMIQAEEAELTCDVAERLRRAASSRMQEMKIFADTEHVKDEENRRATVIFKLQQQSFENCPEIRENISREMVRGVKYANLALVSEKDNRMREKRQSEELWHEIMLKAIEEQLRLDKAGERKRLEECKQTGEILMEQIMSHSASNDEVRKSRNKECEKLEKLREEVRIAEMKELVCERMKRDKLKQDLKEQLILSKRRLSEEVHRKAVTEQELMMITREELEQEKADIAKKSACARREMMAYMKSLKYLQQEEIIRKSEVEATADQLMREVTARRILAMKRHDENRKRLLNDVMAAREIQFKEKLKMQE